MGTTEKLMLKLFGSVVAVLVVLAGLDSALPEGITGDKTARVLATPTVAPTATVAPRAASTPTHKTPLVGEDGRIDIPGNQKGVLASNPDAWGNFADALMANDQDGVDQLQSAQRIFAVSAGTRVRVIGYQFPTLVHVRVMDGPSVQRDGWLPMEQVT